MKKVSIIIPVYNGSNYLSEAVDSALAQTYKNIEIIVINDGSSDGGESEKIAKSYGDKIRYFKKKNGGVGSALNLGIRKMTGDYFSWLSHDDLYHKDKIKLQMEEVVKYKKPVVIYSDYSFINSSGDVTQQKKLPHLPPKEFRYFLTTKSTVHGCSLLIPKIAFEKTGIFNQSLRTTQDYDLWFRMAKEFDFIHLSKSLMMGRIHGEQGTVTMAPKVIRERNSLHISFANKLTFKEILDHHLSLSDGYVYISKNFIKRKLFIASIYSAYKSLVSSKTFKQRLSSSKQIVYSILVWMVESIRK